MNLTNLPSTELLQGVMMASPNGVLVLQAIRRADGQLIDLYMTLINSVAEQELDCPAVEALGQSFAQFFPHLAGKDLLEHYRQVLDTGHSTQFDVKFFRPGQSTPTWLDVSVVQLEKSLLLAYTDITETADKIEPLTDMLQQAFDESVNGISVFEAIHDERGKVSDFKLVMINKAGQCLSGFLHEELVGWTVWEMYPATSINGLFDQYVYVYETGHVVATENYYPEYDIWRDVKIVRVEQGIMVAYNDITAIKKAQNRLKQQEQLLTHVLEAVPVGMVVVEPIRTEKRAGHQLVDFRVINANSALEPVIGQPATQIIGQLLSEAIDQGTVADLVGRCVDGLDQGETQVFNMPLGNSKSYKVSVTPRGDLLILAFTGITNGND